MSLDIPVAPADETARVLGSMHYGLYLLTMGKPDQPSGFLVSWAGQVSGQPPMITVAVRHNRALLPALERLGYFALNLLPAGDLDLARALARPRQERFEGLEVVEGPRGLPCLGSAIGVLSCRVLEVWRPGDHALVLGRVGGASWRGPGPALACSELGTSPYLGLS